MDLHTLGAVAAYSALAFCLLTLGFIIWELVRTIDVSDLTDDFDDREWGN